MAQRHLVYVVFARTPGGDGAAEILLKKKDGNAGAEWMLAGGEMLQEEMQGFKDKNTKNKTLQLAAVRTAALDLGHSAEMPETDFQSIGGKKERLPPSMLKMSPIRLQPVADGKKVFGFLCKLEATDQDYAGNKWKPSGAAPAKHEPDYKWFALPDLLAGRAPGVPSWVFDIVKKSQENFQDRSHANPQAGANARQHAGPGAGAEATANSNAQTYNKSQGGRNGGPGMGGVANNYESSNMMPNMYGGADMMGGGPYGAYQQQQQFPPNYMMPYPPQMEAAPSNLKFKFPAHIISLVVRTTGCRLGKDEIVAIGAAFVKIESPSQLPQIVKEGLFQSAVESQGKFDAAYITADEFKQLQTKAKPAAEAVNDLISFVKDCILQDASSYIAAQNPMVELAMLELAATKHCEGFTSLSHLAGETGGGEQARLPIDLGSLACGLVSTDGKAVNAKARPSKPPSNGRPWATLSEYLQQQIAPGDFEKHVPHPEPSTGRLEPQKEAINKGWHFGNTLCVLADKHQKASAGMGMTMMGIGGNPMMLQHQWQMQQMLHQQWQMQQMQMAYQQNYNPQHGQTNTGHHRMNFNKQQPRQYNQYNHQQYGHNAGRGNGPYHASSGVQGMQNMQGMPPQSPGPPGQMVNRANVLPPDTAKSTTGSSDPLDSSVAAGALPSEGQQQADKEGNATKAIEVPVAVAGAAAVDTPQSAGVVEQVQHAKPAEATQETVQDKVPAEPLPSNDPVPADGVEKKEAVASSEDAGTTEKGKQEMTRKPTSWAQMASKPPQPASKPPPPAAATAAVATASPAAVGHSENGVGAAAVATAVEGSKDTSRREAGADGEHRQSGHRREGREGGQGRGDGGRKDMTADRGGGRGKGNTGGGRGGAAGGPRGEGARGEGVGRGGDSTWRGGRSGGAAGASVGRGAGGGGGRGARAANY